jgi:hypothetical protein
MFGIRRTRMAEKHPDPVATLKPRGSWIHMLVKELAWFVGLLVLGVIVTQNISYPDAKVRVGFDVLDSGGVERPTVILDFDTPTIDQMADFKSTEDFDRWATSFVAIRLAGDSILKSGSTSGLIRVPDLTASDPRRLMEYTFPWSGLNKLRSHLLVRDYIFPLWANLLLPYSLFLVTRGILWIGRKLRRQSPSHGSQC